MAVTVVYVKGFRRQKPQVTMCVQPRGKKSTVLHNTRSSIKTQTIFAVFERHNKKSRDLCTYHREVHRSRDYTLLIGMGRVYLSVKNTMPALDGAGKIFRYDPSTARISKYLDSKRRPALFSFGLHE